MIHTTHNSYEYPNTYSNTYSIKIQLNKSSILFYCADVMLQLEPIEISHPHIYNHIHDFMLFIYVFAT